MGNEEIETCLNDHEQRKLVGTMCHKCGVEVSYVGCWCREEE